LPGHQEEDEAMDKLFEAIEKYVPAPVMAAVVAMAVGFLAVHYWRGFRDYSDTLRDRTFLSMSVLALAGLGLYVLNRAPALPTFDQSPILLVPYFEGDERDQFRTAFVSQLEQTFSKAGEPRPVFTLNPISGSTNPPVRVRSDTGRKESSMRRR
jgi:hypothetical protein